MKHVYLTYELPHIWAHLWREIGHGRNAGNTVFFDSNIIYSYGRHFPMARIIGDNTVALVTSEKYSVTTTRHVSATRQALDGNMPVFQVPDVMAETEAHHLDNWRALRSALNEVRNQITNARVPRDHDINYAVECARVANEYAETFNLTGALESTQYPLVAYTEAERLRLTERVRIGEIEAETKRVAAEARRIEARARLAETQSKLAAKHRRAMIIERLTFGKVKPNNNIYVRRPYTGTFNNRDNIAAAISDWKRGKRARLPYDYDGPVLLRINKARDTVTTSKNVRLPVADCAALWPEIAASHANKTETDDVRQRRIGHYTVQYLKRGDIKAGCHYVTYSEARKLALVMGWEKPTLAERVAFRLKKVA